MSKKSRQTIFGVKKLTPADYLGAVKKSRHCNSSSKWRYLRRFVPKRIKKHLGIDFESAFQRNLQRKMLENLGIGSFSDYKFYEEDKPSKVYVRNYKKRGSRVKEANRVILAYFKERRTDFKLYIERKNISVERKLRVLEVLQNSVERKMYLEELAKSKTLSNKEKLEVFSLIRLKEEFSYYFSKLPRNLRNPELLFNSESISDFTKIFWLSFLEGDKARFDHLKRIAESDLISDDAKLSAFNFVRGKDNREYFFYFFNLSEELQRIAFDNLPNDKSRQYFLKVLGEIHRLFAKKESGEELFDVVNKWWKSSQGRGA